MNEQSKLVLAEEYARQWHKDQTYRGMAYADGHLVEVVQFFCQNGYAHDLDLLIAAWLHDGPEDAADPAQRAGRLDSILIDFGYDVRSLVWAVTGVGPNRRSRNADAYAKIAVTPRAPLLKAGDRVINVRFAEGGHRAMYLKEYPGFRELVSESIPAHILALLDRAHEN